MKGKDMDSDKLTELRDYYDTTDQSAALETAEPGTTTDDWSADLTDRPAIRS